MKRSPHARNGALLAALFAVGAGTFASRLVQRPTVPDVTQPNGATLLPNGWEVSPAGTPIGLPGDMPLTMVRSADGKYLLVNTAGFHDHSINVIDLATSKCVQSVAVAHDWEGMCLSSDGKTLYVSSGGAGGNKKKAKKRAAKGLAPAKTAADEGAILRYQFAGGQLTPLPPLDIDGLDEDATFVSGLASGPDGTLYAANMKNNTIYRLSADGTAPMVSADGGHAPYGLALSPDGATLAVSDWAEDAVRLLDAKTLKESARIAVGSHPNQIVWGKDGRLFVANSGSNSVSVIHGAAVLETIKTSLEPNDPVGSTPDALALSADNKRLYVANADNNDVAVIDTADARESRVLGFLPTAWYPSSISVSADDRKLFIGTAKGLTFRSNVANKRDGATHDAEVAKEKQKFEYIPHILSGDVSVVDLPDAAGLATATKQVLANVPQPPYHAPLAAADDPFAKIKHVVYIIRENRTYDQVFGDMPKGNGDPNLCLFGATVTPNAHALASNYILLDNLYCNAEVSQDGHQWCDAAYATDYTEKAWPLGYSNREAPPDDDDDLSQSPAGYIWNNCAKHGVTFRMYGEGSKFKAVPGAPPKFTGDKALESHASAAYSTIPWFTGARDLGRAKIFIDDLHTEEQNDSFPQFTIMSLPEDHTQALTAKAFTPFAHVGENDEALGQIVDAVSHSKYWASTAIFVIEDDAQNGPDHVDAHRTVGLVISPYVRQGTDSTMYTQASFVRTIELILHLPPMTQFDRNATPLYRSFASTPNLTAYTTIPAQTNLKARNPVAGAGAVASAKMDLSAPDLADPDKLNLILWNALRPGKPMPAPVRSPALVMGR